MVLDVNSNKNVLVTGSAGFIGYHVSRMLLENNWRVIGLDNLSNYYDVSLKKARENILTEFDNYHSVRGNLEDTELIDLLFQKEKPKIVIHLAAQAGVRYSIDNPRSYLESNIKGTFELLEAARNHPPEHILLASTSSVYGANQSIPYKETDKADLQMSFYAATKKSMESISHSYSHLFNMPVTIFRFFTVYGPWGRPDMALFKFTKSILEGLPIDVYNMGNLKRDFTYIDDLVMSVLNLVGQPPSSENKNLGELDSLSTVAPFRIVNIGNSSSVPLMSFIEALETELGIKAKKNYVGMQSGDVYETWADTSLLEKLTSKKPKADISVGIRKFVNWYREYYKL